jgi:branched-chain amino acid transport system substrate-binding protein
VNKVPLIFGGASSPESLAMVPLANRDQVVLLSSVSSSPELARVGGKYFFRICPNDAYQAVILAEWMRERGIGTVATMFLNNSWGSELKNAFEAKFSSLGGKVVSTESCDPGATTFRAQIPKMLAANPEAIFSPTYGKEGGLFLRQLKEAGYKGLVFGGDVWSSPELIETAGNAADGVFFCVPSQFSGPAFDAFAATYKQRYGSEPDIYAALSYDMAKIVCEGIGKGNVTGEALRAYLASMPEYTGVTGPTRFAENGDVIGKAFSRKVWQQGKAVDVGK